MKTLFGFKKLWCVAMRPEYDSPFKQTPAESKEIAQQAVDRYKAANKHSFVDTDFAAFCDEFYQVQQWHGTRKDHIRGMFYTKDWFNEPMYQISNMGEAQLAFGRDDLVLCKKEGSEPIVTKDIEEAKRFYGLNNQTEGNLK